MILVALLLFFFFLDFSCLLLLRNPSSLFFPHFRIRGFEIWRNGLVEGGLYLYVNFRGFDLFPPIRSPISPFPAARIWWKNSLTLLKLVDRTQCPWAGKNPIQLPTPTKPTEWGPLDLSKKINCFELAYTIQTGYWFLVTILR